MGDVIALGVELRRPVHGSLQDAQKLQRDLLPACHGCFDGSACEFPGGPLKLMQNVGYFHWCFARRHFPFILLRSRSSLYPKYLLSMTAKHTWRFKSFANPGIGCVARTAAGRDISKSKARSFTVSPTSWNIAIPARQVAALSVNRWIRPQIA